MDFLKHNLPDCQEKKKKKRNSGTIFKMKSVTENLPTKHPLLSKSFNNCFLQAVQELIIPILHNLFQRISKVLILQHRMSL